MPKPAANARSSAIGLSIVIAKPVERDGNVVKRLEPYGEFLRVSERALASLARMQRGAINASTTRRPSFGNSSLSDSRRKEMESFKRCSLLRDVYDSKKCVDGKLSKKGYKVKEAATDGV